MAIEFIPNTISSGYNLQKINDNFDKIVEAFEDALSRSGNTPNQMNSDLDMNNYNIMNIRSIDATSFSFEGVDFQALIDQALAAAALAQDAIDDCVAQVALATAQVGLATTQATNAATSASNAAASEAGAAAIVAAAGKPTLQRFTTVGAGTWTRPAGCKKIIIEGIGAGGGGGGVAVGAGGTAAAASGGSSGFWGRVDPIDVTAIASASLVIGALGAGGVAGANNGSNGGDTTITVGATTYTFGGGKGGVGASATGDARITQLAGSPTGTNVIGSGRRGQIGMHNGPAGFAQGGYGAESPFGTGGAPPRIVTVTSGTGGSSLVTQYGCGGAGAACVGASSSNSGGDGSPGMVQITEYY